jgi:hypothetical protein
MPCWPCEKEIMVGALCKSCSMDPEESSDERGCGVAVARVLAKDEVAGSNPATRSETKKRGAATTL